ncbi:DUF3828 domain-containing protein [Bradyrhizobium sp. UFLA05-109]
MLTRRSLTLAAACLLTAAPARAGDASATAFVTGIYDSYRGKDAKGVSLDNERSIRRYFEPRLATLMAKDRKAAARSGAVGQLDFDPFLDAQDWDTTTYDITVGDATAGKAQATVKFVNQGQPMIVLLDLLQLKTDWRIHDITWVNNGKTATLREMFVH